MAQDPTVKITSLSFSVQISSAEGTQFDISSLSFGPLVITTSQFPDFLLLETGDFILQEDGGKIKLERSV